MTYNETEKLIERYLEGETTPEEERLLALEVSRPGVPEEWQIIAEMLGGLTLDEALYDQFSGLGDSSFSGLGNDGTTPKRLNNQSPKRLNNQSPKRLRLVWTAAACLVAAAITVPLLWSRQSTPDVVAYVYGQEITDKDAVMELMASTMSDVLDNGTDAVAQDLEMFFGD